MTQIDVEAVSVKAAIYPSRTIKMLSAPHILSLVKVGDDDALVQYYSHY